jgi:flagellin-like hook-associated protein FlgL
VLSILFVGASGAAAYYYTQQGQSVNHAANLNTQIASLNSQIASLNARIGSDQNSIDSLNTRISQLSQAQCTPDSGYSSCGGEIASLAYRISQLQQDKLTLQGTVDSLTTQVNNLTDIVNLKKMQVIAKSVTVNWASCGETGQPSCTPQSRLILPNELSSICSSTCYAGYVNVNWTSTQPLTAFSLANVGNAMSTTVSQPKLSAGTTVLPFPGTGTFFGGFQNDACFYDNFSNLHCPGGTLTFSAAYIY